jgi:7-carboxy-7-deazaguanine synthase
LPAEDSCSLVSAEALYEDGFGGGPGFQPVPRLPAARHSCVAASYLSAGGYTAAGMSATLLVNEIFLSLQGESTFAGLPCVFVRLTGCDLRCSYCDTAYAFAEGRRLTLAEVRAEVRRLAERFGACCPQDEVAQAIRLPLVELTGGEPLLQKNSRPLLAALCDDGFTVLLETSGAHDLSAVDPRVRRIMDLKCPSSGEAARNLWSNLPHLRATDEIKFVIGTVEDYAWAGEQIAQHQLAAICPLLFSWAQPLSPGQQNLTLKPAPGGLTPISRRDLAERILADALPVRFQAQLHKLIWPPDQRGV